MGIIQTAVTSLLVASVASFASAATIEDVNNELDAVGQQADTLTAEASTVSADVHEALLKLKTETNLSEGPLLVGGILPAVAGGTVDWPISFVATAQPVSGLQADLALPTGFTIVSISAGPAAVDAAKTVSFNGNRFILFGLNQTVLKSGVIAIARLRLPTTVTQNLCSIPLNAPVASDPNGKVVLMSATSGTLEVQP